jgi:3-hydroxybutyryl-CoA dehydrogenase
MEISKVGVAGAGLMGHGIAQVSAQAGYDVVLAEIDEKCLASGLGKIEKQLSRAVEKGRTSQQDADAVRRRIRGTVDQQDLADRQLVIEAITEDLAVKREFFADLDGIVGSDGVFASNTSSLSIIDLATATARPERFLGLHFFNPAQVMPLVEVIRAVTTSNEAFQIGLDYGGHLGKTVIPTPDRAGYIVNRLLVPYMLDAIRAYEEGVGPIDQIDAAMKGGAGHPMGPFTLLDFVGLDTTKSIADIMYLEYREKRFAPPPTLRKLVSAGWFGKKSGKGFYDYSGDKPVPLDLRV